MKSPTFIAKVLFLTLFTFKSVLSLESNTPTSNAIANEDGSKRRRVELNESSSTPARQPEMVTFSDGNQFDANEIRAIARSQRIVTQVSATIKRAIAQESDLRKLRELTKYTSDFKIWQHYIREQIDIVNKQASMLQDNLLESIRTEKEIPLLIKQRGDVVISEKQKELNEKQRLLSEQQRLLNEITQDIEEDGEKENATSAEPLVANNDDQVSTQEQSSDEISRNESANSLLDLQAAAIISSSTLVNAQKRRRGRPSKIENAPGLKKFIKEKLGTMHDINLITEWNESETCIANPEYKIDRKTLTRYKKQLNQDVVNNKDAESYEDDMSSETSVEVLPSATTPRSERLKSKDAEAKVLVSPEQNVAASNSSSSSSSAINSIHTVCGNESCELCKCTINEILRLGAEYVENVRNKLFSCPDFPKHKIDGIPLAAYIFSNGSSPIWTTILKTLVEKWGINIFQYTANDGNTTLHWLMKQERSGDLIARLLAELNPNVRNLAGQTPLDYAMQYLSENPGLDYTKYNFIANHIGHLVANNKQLRLDEANIAKLKDLPNKVSDRRRRGLNYFIEEVLQKRNNLLNNVIDDSRMEIDQ